MKQLLVSFIDGLDGFVLGFLLLIGILLCPLQTTISFAQNDDAQADFYRELTKKLTEPTPTPTPSAKTLKQGVNENPALLLTLLGAVIAALVAFVSFVFNYRTTLRIQIDTQFYEALKRFGDKDSPSIRSSAAGLIGQMGQKRIGFRRRRQYLRTALSQLITGLLLEDNPTVLISIGDSLRQLVPLDSSWSANKLYVANRELQEELIRTLSNYFVNKLQPTDEIIHSLQSIDDNVWVRVESITGYNKDVLTELITRHLNRFSTLLGLYTSVRGDAGENKTVPLYETLTIVSQRLRINIQTFALAFAADTDDEEVSWDLLPTTSEFLIWLIRTHGLRKTAEFFRRKPSALGTEIEEFNEMRQRTRRKRTDELINQFYKNYVGVYLPKCQLRHANVKHVVFKDADLQYADFSRARLSRVRLMEANLRGADFSFAELAGVNFRQARLEGTIFTNATGANVLLYGAKVDDTTILDGFAWWKASFVADDQKTLDEDLVTRLFRRYGASVPEDLSRVHSTIRDHLSMLRHSIESK